MFVQEKYAIFRKQRLLKFGYLQHSPDILQKCCRFPEWTYKFFTKYLEMAKNKVTFGRFSYDFYRTMQQWYWQL